jgi:hypothetical protein
VSPAKKKRFYVGLVAVIVALFCVGFFAGFLTRNDRICKNGKAPIAQRDDPTIGQTDYLCSNGQTVTK